MTEDNNVRGQWWRVVADWRNWRLPVKLAAVLAVPVLVAVGAGVVQIRGYIEGADSYAAMQRLVTLRAGLGPLISGVQAERAMSARRAEGAGPDATRFRDLAADTDAAAAAVRALVERTTTLGEVTAVRYRDVTVQLDGLPQLRERVLSGSVDLAGGIGGYSVVLRSLLDLDQAMVGDFGDASLAGTAAAQHSLSMAAEQVSWQHATVLAGISRRSLLDGEQTALEQSWTRFQDKVADFSAVATPGQQEEYRSTVTGPEVDLRNRLVQDLRGDPGAVRGKIPVDQWNAASASTAAGIAEVLDALGEELAASAARLQDQTSDRAGAASVVLLASLFAAAAVGYVVGSDLLRSLRALRLAALDVAERRLPELVAQLREQSPQEVVVEPVPVHTKEELGQLARAFDAVHRQAVNSAAEQADLRAGMRNAFTNLSRRSQSLVERQLKLMEELERQEENPEQLANLFKLDNLATRMRRNNENLMVLSGSDVARRFTRPVPLGDVLRAAASEIEQYHRVVVQATPPVEVVGYAAGDLVRLVAELLDNATSFSPPRTQVIIGGRPRAGGGVLVDVVDQGVGMSEADLAEANGKIARAAGGDTAELSVSRQLGLHVVGTLAGRHGIDVVLREQGAEREGVRATVAVPAELVRAQVAAPVQVRPATPRTPAPAPIPTQAPMPTAIPTTAIPAIPAVPTPTPGQDDGWAPFRGSAVDGRTADTRIADTRSGESRTLESRAAQEPPAGTGGGGTWFGSAAPTPPAPAKHRSAQPQPGAPVAGTGGELPKRRPRSNLVSERPGGAEGGVAPVRRDPNATRGFLASYQTGVRQGIRHSGESTTGRERE
ncbi:sensor histidine kinase [Saccharothrix coeruleofusca]|uniref:histidine kinase n=1 Tax=Saccharothrix coeruleofusca TaxID=33919 RepID=A0A918ARD8_9PSEU|nr:nitrate- and nitrite sensing domain-containing protein [Saccharothrix coeruleofusca]GGP62096.1 hypothetical protein GCM10010185_38070 [Saccharothrix coeruleofusca]